MADKKIGSELKLDNDLFKVKIGTIDKKNPWVFYTEIGTYINSKKTNCKEHGEKLIPELTKYIKKTEINFPIKRTDIICDVDLPTDKIIPNKQSFLSVKTFYKLIDKEKYNSFNNLCNDFTPVLNNEVIKNIESVVSSFNFSMCKTKF